MNFTVLKSEFSKLDANVQAQILFFLDESQLFLFRQKFPTAIATVISNKPVINLSFLLRLFPNTPSTSLTEDVRKMDQQNATKELLQNRTGIKTRYLECINLRKLTGLDWLSELPSSLQTLDLSGCAGILPESVITCLTNSSIQLEYLNLSGCAKLGNSVVHAIADYQTQLKGLWLGRCSQTITNGPIYHLLDKLTCLRHLDLQTLHNISDGGGQFVGSLPDTIESLNISSCEQLRLAGLEALEGIQYHMNRNFGNGHGAGSLDYWKEIPQGKFSRLMHLVLDAVGTPRVGLCRGIVTYFASGCALREVHLMGCEQIQDWEIEALAVTCASTLTCFQMRAGRIGNTAVIALATHCSKLAELDVSACFRVEDTAMAVLAKARRIACGDSKLYRQESCLRILRVASLPGLTDEGIQHIGRIRSLLVLDVQDCIEVSPSRLGETILNLPNLIDVNAKNISEEHPSLLSILRKASICQPKTFPQGLFIVNQRAHSWDKSSPPENCCSARTGAQRLDARIPLAPMYHCVDCKLTPALDRGICSSCVSKCHQGHTTFVGGWQRYYCDCPFGVTANNECQAIFPIPSDAHENRPIDEVTFQKATSDTA